MKLNSIPKIIATGSLIMSAVTALAAQPTALFTPEEEARIGEVAKEYLLAHPEILVELDQKLQVQQNQQHNTMIDTVIQYQSDLLNDKGTPSYGPADASVNVVEFFDYQCIYCARLAPEVEKVIKANPGTRFIFKEWPIFDQRWENSSLAAKTGLQVWRQKGADAYLKYHNGLYASGHNEGKLTVKDIDTATKAVGFNPKTAPNVQNSLDGINSLALRLGIRGTPTIVVLPTTGSNAANVTVISGLATAGALQVAIDKAAEKAKQ